MYGSSTEQIFARIGRIRRQAENLLNGRAGHAVEAPDDLEGQPQIELRLPRLAHLFQLSDLAVDVLICLCAAEYDPFLRLLMRAVQREQGRPWLELGTIAELLELGPARVPEVAQLCAPGGVLFDAALVVLDEAAADAPYVSRRVKVATRIAEYLVDIDVLPQGLSLLEASEHEPLLAADKVEALGALVGRAWDRSEPLVVELTGPAGCGKKSLAAQLAARLDAPLVVADLAAVEPARWERLVGEARRESVLRGGLLCLAHWDALLPAPMAAQDAEAPPVQQPRRLPPSMARLLTGLRTVLFVTAPKREQMLELAAPAVVHAELRFPTPQKRAQLLEGGLEKLGLTCAEDIDLSVLGRRFALDPARIQAASRAALHLARQKDSPWVDANDLGEACRRQLNHELATVARRVTTTYRWEDLVVPEEVRESLQEMIAYVRHGEQVYDRWGFGRHHHLGQGISVLLAGPPGTGKTMCAGVLARELDMELFQVDLSRVVSKWIGETEKNLAKVFDEAQRSSAIILFDEADSLFAKRTEVKSSVDRYANLEVNYLLQRMEAFSGISILTTNFEDSIDAAFKRRLTFRLRFEKPDAEARALLWQKMFPPSCELGDDLSFERVARAFEMSGGNIRNAAVRAGFLAAAEGRPVDMEICLRAAEKECREMGLLVCSPPKPRPVVVQEEVVPDLSAMAKESWPLRRVAAEP